eukprot:2306155-Rhodomonas_salina.1
MVVRMGVADEECVCIGAGGVVPGLGEDRGAGAARAVRRVAQRQRAPVCPAGHHVRGRRGALWVAGAAGAGAQGRVRQVVRPAELRPRLDRQQLSTLLRRLAVPLPVPEHVRRGHDPAARGPLPPQPSASACLACRCITDLLLRARRSVRHRCCVPWADARCRRAQSAGPILGARGIYRLHHFLKSGGNSLISAGGVANILFLNGNVATSDGGFDLAPGW